MNTARFVALCGWLTGALIPAHTAAATSCDRQPVKPERVQILGLDMLVNGVPTSVYGLEFAESPEQVSDEFRAFWTRDAVPAKGQRGPSGLLLTALDDTCHYVLLLAPQPRGAHTKGVMSVMRLTGGATRHLIPDSAVPLPQGGNTVSDVESHDPGQTGRTWIVDIGGDPAANAQRYSSLLTQQGWSTVAQAPAYRLDGSPRVQGNAVALQRGADRLDAVFSDRNGQTEAVVHATRSR
ncbi:MAG TPA: hypothetical protein VGL08_10895 [Paraburkholderia sp.]|jgi:hypothetical protein